MEFAEGFKVFLWAMTPLGELRAAIPLGITLYKMSPISAYFFAVLGNLAAVFLLLTFLRSFAKWSSKKIYFFNRFFVWLFSQTKNNHQDKLEKYGVYFLPLFVAIPLPATGGWTAAFIAFVFGIPFKKAFPLIALGVALAGLIVLALTKAGFALEKNFGWQALVGLLLLSLFIYWLYKKLWPR
ncbi:MAG: Small multidrug export protein [Parcubacteria group bacterium Gr01-1014_30]|nr:MAG: Small multidrug export protein [Parcubacteria group bacterium Gr01-1014_30]